jgi:hypothetical protein
MHKLSFLKYAHGAAFASWLGNASDVGQLTHFAKPEARSMLGLAAPQSKAKIKQKQQKQPLMDISKFVAT